MKEREFSTPSQSHHSKRAIKAFEKSEQLLQKQMQMNEKMGRVPDSRGTLPIFERPAHPYNNYEMQQPNIHYIQSSFERPTQQVGPYGRNCCITPGSAFSVSQSKVKTKGEGKPARSSSETKKKLPETYYINTITNNYYQIKRKAALDAKNQELLQNQLKSGTEGYPSNALTAQSKPQDNCTPASMNSIKKHQ